MISSPQKLNRERANSEYPLTDKAPPSSPQRLLDWLSEIIIHAQSGSAEDQQKLYQLAKMIPKSSTPFSRSIQEVIDLISKVAEEKMYNPKLHETATTARAELISSRSPRYQLRNRQSDMPYSMLNLP